ncbi:MAG: hypothetical protein Kow0081_0400 [Candidatus Dojkabacteria bacterium]
MAKKIALSLRGGGARCAAYFGLLRFLDEEKIKVDAFIGSSGGALIGILYSACGLTEDIITFFSELKPREFVSWKSFFSLNKFDSIKGGKKISEFIGYERLENLPIKVYVQASNISTGRSDIFEQGNLPALIGASSAVSGLASLVRINGVTYTDGDVVSGYASDFLRERGYNFIIGANVDKATYGKNVSSNTVSKALVIAMAEIKRLDNAVSPVDFLFDKMLPEDKYHIFSFSSSKKIADLGYEFARAKKDELLDSLRK